jgi:hypothetical protein
MYFRKTEGLQEHPVHIYWDRSEGDGHQVMVYYAAPPLKTRGVWICVGPVTIHNNGSATPRGTQFGFLARPLEQFDEAQLDAVAAQWDLNAPTLIREHTINPLNDSRQATA